MTDPFVHLHVHSSYSILDGAAKVEDMVVKAAADGAPGLGITDHGVMYGLPEFYRTCKTADINPILGMEAYFADDRTDRSSIKQGEGSELDGTNKRYYHLTLLAETNTGYSNLMKLSSDAYLNGFYAKGRCDWSTLEEFHKGLIATTGCLGGPVLQRLLHNDYDGALAATARLQDIFGKENLFVELQDHGLPEQARTNPQLIQISRDLDAPLLAVNDSHYTNHEDALPHDALLCCQTGALISDEKRFRFQSDQHYLKSAQEMRHLFREVPVSCDNTLAIAERANVHLDFDTLHIPNFDLPEGFSTPGEFLALLCNKGLAKRYGTITEEAEQRLQYELSTIDTLGLSAYFLIVWDIVRWADKEGIPRGPGRGSVGGSLASFCLNISKVDPLKYDLLFERFLNPSRISMPDIDLDFSPRDREKIINYIVDKYGSEQVAQIITFGTIRARSAVKDANRVLGFPPKLGDTISKKMPALIMGEPTPLWACFEKSERYSSGYDNAVDLRNYYANNTDAKKVVDVAMGLEGLIRSDGIHAAGLLITPGPVTDFVPIQRKGDDKPIVAQYEKTVCEDLGLLKMDILGLRNLDVIKDTLDAIDDDLDLDSPEFMRFDDLATYELLQRGDTVGCFQLESSAMADLLRAVRPNTIEDLSAVIALYRPGPMGTNMHYEYAHRKNGSKPATPFHPDASEILLDTYGLMVFQEQLMQVAQKFAGYSGVEADDLRKIMGKKLIDKMASEKAKFIQGCIDTGYSQELADDLFHTMESFAMYAFNKSHSMGYAFIAYQTAYLKANYPVQYMAALCESVSSDAAECAKYMNTAKNMGIKVVGPDVSIANVGFSSKDDTIVAGLGAIKWMGQTAHKIVSQREERAFRSLQDFVARCEPNSRELRGLVLSGGLDGFAPRRGLLVASEEILVQSRRHNKGESTAQTSLFESLDYWDITIPDLHFDDLDRLAGEKETLGLYITGNPVENFQDYSTDETLDSLTSSGEVLVTVMSIETKKTRAGAEMAFLVVGDKFTTSEVIIFPKKWAELRDFAKEDIVGVMEFKVQFDAETETRKLVCDFFAPVSNLNPTINKDYDEVCLRVPRGFASNEMAVSKLKGILASHQGPHPVVVQLSEKTQIDLKDDFRIMWNDDVRKAIGDLFVRYSADKKLQVNANGETLDRGLSGTELSVP